MKTTKQKMAIYLDKNGKAEQLMTAVLFKSDAELWWCEITVKPLRKYGSRKRAR